MLLERYLPRRIKRMIFLSTIAQIVMRNNPNIRLTNTINKILKLAHDPRSLEFPMTIRHMVWKNLVNEPQAAERLYEAGDTNQLINLFYSNAPDYLLYDTQEVIEKDLALMFTSLVALD